MLSFLRDYLGWFLWRVRVMRNRARNPDIVRRIDSGELTSFSGAQLMLVEARSLLRRDGILPSDPRYPDLHDFWLGEGTTAGTIVAFRGIRALREERQRYGDATRRARQGRRHI